MNALFDAIKSRFDATSATHGITGGMFADATPAGTTMPFCEYATPAGDYGECYAAANYETATIDFKVVQVGRRAAIALAELLAAQYRGTALTVAGGTMFHVSQTTGAIPMQLDADEYGRDVWQASVSFEFSTTA